MSLIFQNSPLHSMDFQWWNPTRIIFGNGKVKDLGDDLSLDWTFDEKHKAMVVTDQGVKQAGLLDYLLDSLKGSPFQAVSVFDNVLEEADSEQVYQMAQQAADSEIDFFIALGGGSVMDACKATAVLDANAGRLEDYVGLYLVPEETKPIVCLPTTAGTGSEVTWGAVVMDRKNKRKMIIGDYKFIPKVAVLDPELTKTLPRRLVAATALDALTHSIGALVSVDRQDFSSALALRAIEMIADNLEEAYQNNATNLDVRSKLLIASCMSGIAFQTALPGADHGIGHTAGALHELHHGLAVGIANLYVMEYNMREVPQIYASVARALGVRDEGLSGEALGEKAIERLKQLYGSVDVKLSYSDYGFPTDQQVVERLIEESMEDPCMAFNPVGISRTPEFERLVKRCIGG